MITTNNKISYFGFNFLRKATCYFSLYILSLVVDVVLQLNNSVYVLRWKFLMKLLNDFTNLKLQKCILTPKRAIKGWWGHKPSNTHIIRRLYK